MKKSISYSDELEETITKLIEDGYVESYSQFFQQSALSHLMLLDISAQAFETTLPDGYEADDVEALIESIENNRL